MNHRPEVDDYMDAILRGKIAVGRLVRLAIEREQMDRERAESRGLYFDDDAANDAIDFFPVCLKHTDGEYVGKEFNLCDWQKFVMWVLFGWRREKDHTRRFRETFVSVGRGNGKSCWAAGLALQLAFMDRPTEYGAEVYCAATKRDQAKIVWQDARRMVEGGPLSINAGGIVECWKTGLSCPQTNSSLKPLGSDSSQSGYRPHGVIFDELHEWRDHHRDLFDKLVTGLGKRRQPMSAIITTAGDDEALLWEEQYGFSKRVVEQLVSPPTDWFGDDHFSYIAELDKEDDIYDEANWPKANPMLLVDPSPVKIDHIRSMAAKAKNGDIVSEMRLRRYHCNQMVASTEKPITPELWRKGNGELPDLTGTTAFAGLDLARANDFAALTLVFPLLDGEYGVKTWAWTVRDRSEILQGAEFEALLRADNLIIHEGDQIEYAGIRQKCVELAEQYRIASWAYDPNWAHEAGEALQNEHGFEIVAFKQTCANYNEPIVRFLDLLRRGKIRHDGDRLLAWQANNLIVRKNAVDLRLPDKAKSKNKIDSMVALFMAFREAMFGQPQERNYYEENELEMA